MAKSTFDTEAESLASFFLGHLCRFFGVACVFFIVWKQQSRTRGPLVGPDIGDDIGDPRLNTASTYMYMYIYIYKDIHLYLYLYLYFYLYLYLYLHLYLYIYL